MDKIVFIHIPRTSGKSFWGNTYRFMPGPQSKLATWSGWAQEPNPGRFLSLGGHISPNIINLVGGPAKFVTMLRDPIERLISQHRYLMRHEWWAGKYPDAHALEGFLSSPKTNVYVQNTICRYLGTNLDANHVRAKNGQWRTPDVVMEWSVEHEDIEEVYKRALSRLDEFFFVGFKERHPRSVEMFLRKIKSKSLPGIRTVQNVNHQDSLPKSTLDLIEPFVKYDRILYNKAKEAFVKEYG